MIKLRYDFAEFNDDISNYLEKIVFNSLDYYKNQMLVGEVNKSNQANEINCINNAIDNFQNYLYYLFVNNVEFPIILNTFINNLSLITVLPNSIRGVYGFTDSDKKIVYINPNTSKRDFLSSEERIHLYLIYELGHIINSV